MNAESLRADFPILRRKINGKPLIYLDNAATTQKPRQVIGAVRDYYENYNANVHRGIHRLSEEATDAYEAAHVKAAKFIGADFKEVIFTKNTTESINLLAYSLGLQLRKDDEILLSEMEHHSNLVPWQQIAKKVGAKVMYAKVSADGLIDMDDFSASISSRTRIISIAHVSNVLGTINPVREMAKIAHDNGSLFVVDAAQSVPHMPVDVRQIGCDFLAFSSHKMLGPTGIGVLYGRSELLDSMQPFIYGGDMIREVTFGDTRFNELPWKFEAGTPNISGAIGFGAAIDYLKNIGMESVFSHEQRLSRYASDRLLSEPEIKVYGPKERAGIVSFNMGSIHAHDVAAILDQEGIAIRGGHHCAMPLMSKLGISGSARASFYLYNTKDEVDSLVSSLGRVRKVFGGKG
ncbi:cysteine desulfurase [Candidatus Woesearchaeota archaeon]|nr:cysteine desulfurase [Candidatus Woesearchaeota archaeon]